MTINGPAQGCERRDRSILSPSEDGSSRKNRLLTQISRRDTVFNLPAVKLHSILSSPALFQPTTSSRYSAPPQCALRCTSPPRPGGVKSTFEIPLPRVGRHPGFGPVPPLQQIPICGRGGVWAGEKSSLPKNGLFVSKKVLFESKMVI